MGVYHKFVCDELRESIDPNKVGDFGARLVSITNPNNPFGSLLVFTMASKWCDNNVRIINNIFSCDRMAYFEYTDITEEMVKKYNDNIVHADVQPLRFVED